MSARVGRRVPIGWWLAIAASVAVIATVVCALVVMGSPAQQRRVELDARQIEELGAISRAIDVYVTQNKKLPASLGDLDGSGQWLSLKDPDDHSPYGYATSSDTTYQLCAVFGSSTQAADVRDRWAGAEEWPHPAGRHCFDRKAKKN
ncbi:MAG: hypothetical protein JWL98_1946 [Xanthomonadaceae bacterium]|nr:hypothetical protein [Xanthomonadaceae bacterium]